MHEASVKAAQFAADHCTSRQAPYQAMVRAAHIADLVSCRRAMLLHAETPLLRTALLQTRASLRYLHRCLGPTQQGRPTSTNSPTATLYVSTPCPSLHSTCRGARAARAARALATQTLCSQRCTCPLTAVADRQPHPSTRRAARLPCSSQRAPARHAGGRWHTPGNE